jgi:dTMP kinase
MARELMKIGKLFVFEGPNGVGKSTLATAVLDELHAAGEPVELWSFPGKEPGTVAEWIYRLYHDPAQFGVPRASPEALQTLVTAAHIEIIRVRILPALESGRPVLLDRYWWSTWVYATLEGVPSEFTETLIKLELQAWQFIRPSILFLIAGPTRKAIQRANTDNARVVELYTELQSRKQSEFAIQVVQNVGRLETAEHEIVSAIQSAGLYGEH